MWYNEFMRVYIAHSREFDYVKELYEPLRKDKYFEECDLILPHERDNNSCNARDFYRNIDVVIAECSYPSTGLGIELGFAYDDKTPIYCLYRSGAHFSNAIKAVSDKFYEYSLKATEDTREKNKKLIVDYISTKLLEILDVDN